MICNDPYVKAGEAFPCGKCLPCLIRRRELWKHRCMMEALCHADNAFVTLTYRDDALPVGNTLVPEHLSGFMKRLRKSVEPRRIRFYAVGEYGESTSRPHYHAMLFGYATCLRGRSAYSRTRLSCCSQCDAIRDVWGYGNVGLGTLTPESAGYTLSYIVKNMRRTDDTRLKGRWPEFARMSLKPGIGYDALWEVADTLMRYNINEKEVDVPTGARVGKSIKPYGRYLRQKLRLMVGKDVSEGSAFDDEEMRVLWDRAVDATPKGGEIRRNYFKNLLADASAQRIRQMEARLKLKQRKSL